MNISIMKIRIILNCAAVVFLLLLTADWGKGPLLHIVATLERQTVDWRLARGAGSGRKNEDIVIVDINRDSLQEVGNWPWPRDRLAQILDRLEEYEVRAAAFSFPFSSPNDEGLAIFDEVRNEIGGDSPYFGGSGADSRDSPGLGAPGFPGGGVGGRIGGRFSGGGESPETRILKLRARFDYDQILAAAMKDRLVVLGYTFDNSARVEGVLPPPAEFHDMENPADKMSSSEIDAPAGDWNFYRGYAANLEKLLHASSGAGFVNYTADEDGFVRRMPLLARHAKKNYESLALAILRRTDVAGQITKLFAEGSGGGVSEVLAGGGRAPINRAGETYLNFLGKGGPVADFENSGEAVFRYVSASDVMRGAAPKEVFKGKIALIGSSSDVLRDVYSTPLNQAMPGAELLATQIANIKDGKVLRRPSGTSRLALLVAGGLLAAALFSFLGPVASLVLTFLLCGGVVYTSIALWDGRLEIVDMVSPLLVFIGLFLWNSISGFIVEWRSSRNLKSTFGQYVPPELAKQMGERQALSLEGESREISVLFSDVRNFTSISETFTPQELTKMMNRMLTVLSEEIHRQNGTVDKFIGDAVMAFWNAPLDEPAHAAKAVASAMAMQDSMKKLSDELEKEGHPPMRLGVGVCSGEASVGNMGSKLRMAYTAMGDTVNVASRVEGLTKYYKVGVLVTESTHVRCASSGIKFRVADEVRVKGRNQALKIYQPLGDENLFSPEQREALETFEQMRECYVRGEFTEAMEKIKQYRAAEPEDGLGEVYEERIAEFLRHPPEDWDGVTNFETK